MGRQNDVDDARHHRTGTDVFIGNSYLYVSYGSWRSGATRMQHSARPKRFTEVLNARFSALMDARFNSSAAQLPQRQPEFEST
jgi:hypothetical protein